MALRLTSPRRIDQGEHAVELSIVQHIGRRESQNSDPLLRQSGVVPFIVRCLLWQIMHETIDLNGELRFGR